MARKLRFEEYIKQNCFQKILRKIIYGCKKYYREKF